MNLAFMAAQGCASERARELGSLEGILSAEAHPALFGSFPGSRTLHAAPICPLLQRGSMSSSAMGSSIIDTEKGRTNLCNP